MSLWDLLGGALSIDAGYDLANDLRTTGATAASDMDALAQQLQGDTAFRGYGVTTGLGTTTVDPSGTTNLGVGIDQGLRDFSTNLYGGAQNAYTQAINAANAGATNQYADQSLAGMQAAQQMLQGSSSNPMFSQATNMAMQNASNPAYAQAMGMYSQNASNPYMGQASSLAMQNAGNMYGGQAANMLSQGAGNMGYGAAVGAQANAMQGLGVQQANSLSASQQAMQNAMSDRTGREQDIYSRAMAMQQPGLDAQRAQQQAREFAQGRSGVRGSQFGGTAEDAAMARAQAQAQNQASFQAMSQAEQEAMNQAGLASQFGQLGQSAAGLQGSLGMNIGGLGAQQAQLLQSAGSALGGLGAQNAQLGQSAAGLLSSMGLSNAQLGQAAAAGMGSLGGQQAQLGQSVAQLLGGLGNQQAQLGQSAAGQYGSLANMMGQLGASNAQLGQASGGLLSQIAAGQGSLGSQMYGNQYMDLQAQLQAAGLGGQNADRAQTGQITGANLGGQLGLGGIQSQVNAERSAAELYAKLFGAGAGALSSGMESLFDLF